MSKQEQAKFHCLVDERKLTLLSAKWRGREVSIVAARRTKGGRVRFMPLAIVLNDELVNELDLGVVGIKIRAA